MSFLDDDDDENEQLSRINRRTSAEEASFEEEELLANPPLLLLLVSRSSSLTIAEAAKRWCRLTLCRAVDDAVLWRQKIRLPTTTEEDDVETSAAKRYTDTADKAAVFAAALAAARLISLYTPLLPFDDACE